MATVPQHEILDVEEQLVRIAEMRVRTDKLIQDMQRGDEKMSAEIRKLIQDTRLATPQMFFQGALAMAALIGAGAALGKLLFPN